MCIALRNSFLYLFLFLDFPSTAHSCSGRNSGCFHGETQAGSTIGLTTQQCPGLQDEWCAISYSVSSQRTGYHCGNEIQATFGVIPSRCGIGGLGINDGGCQMMNGPNGPCYVCCCTGFQCNNPMLFSRDASSYFNGGLIYNNSALIFAEFWILSLSILFITYC